MRNANFFIAGTLMLLMLSGCAAFLPSTKEVVPVPWKSFQEVQTAYGTVVRNQTTVLQLKQIGFDIYSTPNVRILSYIDIATNTQNIKFEDLSSGLALCIKVKDNCLGYQIEPKVMVNERMGNFWLDIFNFKRKTKGTGWRFKALFLIIDDVVVDKFWSGDPKILEERETKNPLGPLQEAGAMVLRLIP